MEGQLHLIERDLADHEWYVELVADFVEDVQLFVWELEEV
jgi:hypothetical protein